MTTLRARWISPAPTASALVVAAGVFDVLHVGHLRFLTQAAELGDALVVAVEDDDRVRAWKGEDRPVNPAVERAELLEGFRVVAATFIVSGPTDAVDWQSYTELLAPLHPAVLVHTVGDAHAEQKALSASALGARSVGLPLLPGHSSTRILDSR